MSFLFKRNPKTPAEVVRALTESVSKLESLTDRRRSQEEAARLLASTKAILQGDGETDPTPDAIAAVAQEMYAQDTLQLLVTQLRLLDFDSRKDVEAIFSTLLRRQIGLRLPTVDHLLLRPAILSTLLRAPEHPETVMLCGTMLRYALRFEQVTRAALADPWVFRYFDYCQLQLFEVATDAFSTLTALLTVHKKAAAEFLEENYTAVAGGINRVLQLKNYVTKRQLVKLLALLVLCRQNHVFLNRYVDDVANLKIAMMLLSDKSKILQLEGFDIFKVFVAKPRKTKPVLDVLIKNKENFGRFFQGFDVAGNDTLAEERDYILGEISKLPDIRSE